jgi:stress-induced-phosphoprotein 1
VPKTTPTQSKPVDQEDVKMAEPEDDEDDEAKAKKEAENEKQKGSEAYKKRDFATASQAFEKAWELWPKDITFLTNLAGS